MRLSEKLEAVLSLCDAAKLQAVSAIGGQVDNHDGDTLADCYYNAMHEQDGRDVAQAIAAAINLLRDHGEDLRRAVADAALWREVSNTAWFVDQAAWVYDVNPAGGISAERDDVIAAIHRSGICTCSAMQAAHGHHVGCPVLEPTTPEDADDA